MKVPSGKRLPAKKKYVAHPRPCQNERQTGEWPVGRAGDAHSGEDGGKKLKKHNCLQK